ncbi:MAG TPA: hypothetical protein QGI07_08655 [Dehalococcoidia bacterium]|nr:hypothetical protein [Chloroflexota bacterium]MDP5877746.1 hypothetical protein [Dehalococcoidia bacterium]MDP6272658.1 hypothetical protein [Dehalococcoidia bacterium]MDP7160409.1 hypothetical protein [Dehalococcoidia bacterium]MDP7212173.1 hypothetical protein [Dehalococcoidia bacterium]
MAEMNAAYCPRDPETETNLRCGRCEELICPNCLIHTEVGSRCPDCAQIRTLPMFEASSGELGKAAAAGFGTAIVVGIASGFILGVFNLSLGGVVAVGGAGWLIGEVVHRASGYKQSRPLQWIAGLATLLAFIIVTPFEPLGTLIGLIIGSYYAIQRVKPPRGVQ